MLILTRYIEKHELFPLQKYFDMTDIVSGARKVLKDLAQEIKPPQKLANFRFFKVRIGKRVHGRMIVFVAVGNQKVVPLLIRLKKDKIFGMNMAMNNPAVVKKLNTNLDAVLDDIKQKRFVQYDMKT